VVADRVTLGSLSGRAVVASLLIGAVVSTSGIPGLGKRMEGVILVAALTGLLLLGRWERPATGLRTWLVLPVGASTAHSAVRVIGACMGSSALMLTLILRSGGSNGGHPVTGQPSSPIVLGIGGLIAIAMATGLLVVTSESAGMSSRVVAVGGICGLITGLCWCGFVLSRGYVDAGSLTAASLLAVIGCAASATVVTASVGTASRESLQSGLLAAVIAVLVIFTGPMATYSLRPSTVPDPSPGSHWPQLSQYAHDEQDATEAIDPYVLTLLVGGALSMGLIVSVREPRRQPQIKAIPAQTSGAPGGPPN
jgi:hypothetical protein